AIVNGRPFIFWDTSLYLALGRLLMAGDPLTAIVALQNDPSLVGAALSGEDRMRLLAEAGSHLGARAVLYSVFIERTTLWLTLWGPAALQCLAVSAALWAGLYAAFGRAVDPFR